MHSKKKTNSALAQVREASGLTLEQFATLLGVPRITAQSACRGIRPLPDESKLEVLQFRYGIDLASLKTSKAMMIGGVPVTPERCQNWSRVCGLEVEEAQIAFSQLNPMIGATLKCLSEQDPIKARVLLHKLCAVIDEAHQETALRSSVERLFQSPGLGTTYHLDHYKVGADLKRALDDCDDLPTRHPQWREFVGKVNSTLPVKVLVRKTPTYGLPSVWIKLNQTGKKSLGLGSQWVIRKVFTISQEGLKSRKFLKDEISAKAAAMKIA